MLTQRLFAHAYKKHNLTINQYLEKYNIDMKDFIKRKEYYKNGKSRRDTINKQKKRISNN